MKKRSVVYLVYAMFFSVILFIVSYSNAAPFPAACPSVNESVCGQCPDSSSGYGQIMFLDVPSSCNNFADGICPEDFQNGTNDDMPGNCSNCQDPDCTGTVNGTVYAFNNLPLERAIVKSLPIRYYLNASSMEKNTTTAANGRFSLSGVTTGTYYFSASQEGYDTQLVAVTVLRNQVVTDVNFYLANGTCFEDCTNSYGRCKAQCDGLNFSAGGICGFYNTTVATLCDNRVKGTEIMVGPFNTTHSMFVNCCEGVPYPRYHTVATISTSSIKNLAKIEKIVRYNDQPVKLVIAYWPGLE